MNVVIIKHMQPGFDDDIGGARKLRVENPFPSFSPTDPSLSVYLQKRAEATSVTCAS